jgi:hypothetical protein
LHSGGHKAASPLKLWNVGCAQDGSRGRFDLEQSLPVPQEEPKHGGPKAPAFSELITYLHGRCWREYNTGRSRQYPFSCNLDCVRKRKFCEARPLSSRGRSRLTSYFFRPPWLLPIGGAQMQQSSYGLRQKADVGLSFRWLKPSAFLDPSCFHARPQLHYLDGPVQLLVHE